MSVIFLHPDGDIAGRTTMSGSEIRKMLPAEALVRAISQTTGMKFGKCDCVMIMRIERTAVNHRLLLD